MKVPTHDEVLSAINEAKIGRGLCCAFGPAAYENFILTRVLRQLGGRKIYGQNPHSRARVYFWPLDEAGHQQRLMMLAFMYEWTKP